MDFPTQTDVIDDRTLAYYIGDVINANNENNENDDNVFHPDDMQFHTSWDWLMPVLGKIEDLNYELPEDSNLIGDITHGLVSIDIEMTFEAVVEFIEYYNQNK